MSRSITILSRFPLHTSLWHHSHKNSQTTDSKFYHKDRKEFVMPTSNTSRYFSNNSNKCASRTIPIDSQNVCNHRRKNILSSVYGKFDLRTQSPLTKRSSRVYEKNKTTINVQGNNGTLFDRSMFNPSRMQSRTLTVIPADVPKLQSLSEMKKVLKQSGLPVVDGFTALAVDCILCDKDKAKGTMYVNKTTGYFSCATCLASGDWSMLVRALRFSPSDEQVQDHLNAVRNAAEEFSIRWQHVVKETEKLGDLETEVLERLFALFEWPYNPEGAAALSDVRCNSTRTALYFPLRNEIGKEIGFRRLQAGGGTDVEGNSGGLFTCRALRPSKSEQAVLVPSVSDLIFLAKDRVPGLLVWWYADALPPAALPVLESFKRVVMWGGGENIRSAGDKLGQERCRFVRAMQGATTATEAAGLPGGTGRLRAAVAEAPPAAHRSITTFKSLREAVRANVTNAEKVKGIQWKRFPMLNKLLGGHRRGELTVLTGATGCGKTTLCAEMSLDLATSGVNTLWGSFEIRNTRLAQTMLQQHAGLPLEEHLDRFDEFADQFERLPIYYLAFHGPQPIPLVMEAVEHARYVHDIAHVVVDNVQFMLGVGNNNDPGRDRFFRQDAVVEALRGFATRTDCHVTLVMHPRKERDAEDLSTSSIFGSAKATQEADNVLIIQDKRLTNVRGKKYLQVAKNRFSGDLGIVPMEFDKSALSYKSKKKAKPKESGVNETVDDFDS